MKRALIITTLLLLGAGCQLPNAAVSPTETSEQGEVEAPVFDVTKFVPDSALDVAVIDLDLNGDGVFEKAITYTQEMAPLDYSSLSDTIYTLRVYYWTDDAWQLIKEDLKNKKLTVGSNGRFCQIEVATFTRDYLLVRKCHTGSGDEGYYLFGYGTSGQWGFGDIDIPKAYLHPELYLTQPGDRSLTLERVEVVSDGLIERYDVDCEEQEDGTYCRALQVKQTLEGEAFVPTVLSESVAKPSGISNPPNGVLFDPDAIAIGEQVGGMTLEAIGTNRHESFVFTGTIELTGRYYVVPEDEPFFPGWACFEDLNADSLTRIPDAEGDGRTIWFCFSNQDEALAMFEKTEGTATITISRYVIDLFQSSVVNMATLVSVKE